VAASATAPDIVVIAGGQNDFSTWTEDPQAITDAIWQTYADARAKFSGARIIAVGPSILPDVTDEVVAMDAEVASAAASIGAEYVSLLDPDVLDPSMDSGDGGHVGDAGHLAIAERFLSVVAS
jgi:lysophospholipase L1-like esterase